MEPKEGVVIWINRETGMGCVRTPREFDHEFSLSEAPRHLKVKSSVSYVSVKTDDPEKPIAVQVRYIPKPVAA